MLTDLRAIEAAQEVYRVERGSCPASFEQLTNAVHLETFGFAFRFVSDGLRWSVSVPQQGLFAGNYLLTSDHRVHFRKSGPATTNDPDLRTLDVPPVASPAALDSGMH
jgi:hypothetical protein